MQHHRLTRSRHNRVFTGLAGGLGFYFGIDPNLARLAVLALILIDPRFFILYVIAAFIVPEADPITTA